MDSDLYETPLPVLSAGIDKITAEAADIAEGSFRLKNAGGGTLAGKILSNTRCLRFTPESFSGNQVLISYQISLDIYKPGEQLQTSAVLRTNGGELLLPVYIKFVPRQLRAEDGAVIATLRDFAAYARENSAPAAALLAQPAFGDWLRQQNYEYLEAYEHFSQDPNAVRALDNFLVLSGMKKKALPVIREEDRRLLVKIRPADREPVRCAVPVAMTGWGYAAWDILTERSVPWLQLPRRSLTRRDFDENGRGEISFTIDPLALRADYGRERLSLSGSPDAFADVIVRREAAVSARLDKRQFLPNETGRLTVVNRTGGDLMLELLAEDSFVKLEGRRYYISGRADIPFTFKLSPVLMAQMALKKQPLARTALVLRAAVSGKVIRRRYGLEVLTIPE